MGEPAGQEPNGPFETGADAGGDRVIVMVPVKGAVMPPSIGRVYVTVRGEYAPLRRLLESVICGEGTVMVSTVTGIQVEAPLTETPKVREVQVLSDGTGNGVPVAWEAGVVKTVTVRTGPVGEPCDAGAVIMVDQVSGLPSGTVTVRTTVAVWPGP